MVEVHRIGEGGPGAGKDEGELEKERRGLHARGLVRSIEGAGGKGGMEDGND